MSTDKGADEFYAAVGHRIRAHRAAIGLTQFDLAAASGLVRSSIANLEAGRQHVSAHTLVLIATTLHCDVADLMPGAPTPHEGNLVKTARVLHATLGEFLDQFDELTTDCAAGHGGGA